MTLPPGALWLDAEGSQSGRFGGPTARYVASHAAALQAQAPDLIQSIGLSSQRPVPGHLDPVLGPRTLEWKGWRPPSPLPRVFHAMSPLERLDPSGLAPIDLVWPRWAREGVGLVVTLFNPAPWAEEPEHQEADPILAASYAARLELIRSADQVLVLTETAAGMARGLGIDQGRVAVIGAGPPAGFAARIGSQAGGLRYLGEAFPLLRPGFMLYVADDEPRANLSRLVDAYGSLPEALRAGHQLAVMCELTRARRRELFARAGRLGISRDDLLLVDRYDDRMLSALYRACEVYVCPAFGEGAGLTMVEAMSCQAPVAASADGCAEEILGDSRATFDPADATAIAATLEHLLTDAEEQAALRNRSRTRTTQLSWERVAERTLDAYERVPQRAMRVGRSRRRRLALVTPWPPQQSGVANHSRQLVSSLSRYADIDVIVAGENGVDAYERPSDPRVQVHSATDFDWLCEMRYYHRLLYVLGNSKFHVHVLRLLTERPGHMLIHDVRLTGLYEAASRSASAEHDLLTEKLIEMYGDRVPRKELRRVPDFAIEDRHGIFMAQDVQRHAEKVLAHSRYALDLLRLECRERFAPPPSEIVSLGVPEPPAIASGNGDAGGGPLIVSYGIVALIKGLDPMLHAFAELLERRPGARLLLVGHVTPTDRRYVDELACELGITDSVEVRGHVDRDEYWRTLAGADLALQLRMWSNGEASAAVADCVAARVPTIVSDIGWFGELPDGVAQKVPRDSTPEHIAERMVELLDDASLRDEIREAQDEYVSANSYDHVAERYAEALEL